MKKILALFAVLTALVLMVSCGSSANNETGGSTGTGETVTDEDSGTADSEPGDATPEQPDNEETGRKQGELYGECYPNATCNKGLLCDEENNICIKDPGTSEKPENDSDDTDVSDNDSDTETPESEEPDNDSDTSDSDDADTSDDAQSDEDADADSGDPDEQCTTIDAKLWWSSKSEDTMNWLSALNYCEDLNVCGHSDWKLPTIDELKTLLKWRRDSQCKVSDNDNCLSFTDCWTCSSCCHDCTLGGGGECNYSSYYYDGRYSELGDSGLLWSSSVPTEYTHSAWTVNFNAAQVYNKSKSNETEVYVRCVRQAQ